MCLSIPGSSPAVSFVVVLVRHLGQTLQDAAVHKDAEPPSWPARFGMSAVEDVSAPLPCPRANLLFASCACPQTPRMMQAKRRKLGTASAPTRRGCSSDDLTAHVSSIASGDSRLLSVLRELSQLCREPDVFRMMETMIEALRRLVPVARASIQIVDGETGELHEMSEEGAPTQTVRHKALAAECVRTAASVVIHDASDARLEGKGQGMASLLCVPVLGSSSECQASSSPQQVVAVIELIDRQAGGAAPVAFDAEDQGIVEVLASLLAVIFSRTSLYDDAVRMHSRADALLKCSTALHAEGVPRHKAMRVMQVGLRRIAASSSRLPVALLPQLAPQWGHQDDGCQQEVPEGGASGSRDRRRLQPHPLAPLAVHECNTTRTHHHRRSPGGQLWS